MGQQLPRGLTPETVERVVIPILERKHGDGTATPIAIEAYDPFRATIEVIDPNKVWVHVYLIWQAGDSYFLKFQRTREEVRKDRPKTATNLGELLQNVLSKKKE